MVLLLAVAASCKAPSTPAAASTPAAEAPRPPSAAAEARGTPPAAAEAPGTPPVAAESPAELDLKDLVTLDLTEQGLPLVLDVPRCAKVMAPLVKGTAKVRDVALVCESDMGIDGVTFEIELGLAKGKEWKKEILARGIRRGSLTETPDFLQYMPPALLFGSVFRLRTKVGGAEYMCASSSPTTNNERLNMMKAACLSIRAK